MRRPVRIVLNLAPGKNECLNSVPIILKSSSQHFHKRSCRQRQEGKRNTNFQKKLVPTFFFNLFLCLIHSTRGRHQITMRLSASTGQELTRVYTVGHTLKKWNSSLKTPGECVNAQWMVTRTESPTRSATNISRKHFFLRVPLCFNNWLCVCEVVDFS